MNSWADRIKIQMKELDLTQEELAQRLGITRGAITHYLSGRRVPPLKQFHKLAEVLKVDPAWLQYGTAKDSSQRTPRSRTSEEAGAQPNHQQIPIFTWEQVSKQPDVSRISSKNIKDWIANFYADKTSWFAMRVRGDSMISTTGQRSFYDGDIIIVDPNLQPKNGDLIVAVLSKNNDASFKQYIIDSGVKYLKPLNGQYPMIEIKNKCTYCGVVVHSFSDHQPLHQ